MRITRRMRRLIILVVLGAAIYAGVMWYFSGETMSCELGKSSDPEGRVKSALHAMEDKDLDKVTPYFTPPAAAAMHLRLTNLYTKYDTLRVENLDTTLLYIEGDTARVLATYDQVYTLKGDMMVDKREQRVKMVRLDDVWYINEAI